MKRIGERSVKGKDLTPQLRVDPSAASPSAASGPHLGTQVWPGLNNVIMVAAEDAKVAPILDGVRELRRRLGREGVKAFVMPLEELT